MSFSTKIGSCRVGLWQRVLISLVNSSDGQVSVIKAFLSINQKRPLHLYSSISSNRNHPHVISNVSGDINPDQDGRRKKPSVTNDLSVPKELQEKPTSNRLVVMRMRLREKHRLGSNAFPTAGTHDGGNNEEPLRRNDDNIFMSNTDENVYECGTSVGNEDQLQTDFINNLRSANLVSRTEKQETFVEATFGLLRLDNMNNGKHLKKSNNNNNFVERELLKNKENSSLNPAPQLAKMNNNLEKKKREMGVNVFDEQYFTGVADQTWNKILTQNCQSDVKDTSLNSHFESSITKSQSESNDALFIGPTQNKQVIHPKPNESSKLQHSPNVNNEISKINQISSKQDKRKRVAKDSFIISEEQTDRDEPINDKSLENSHSTNLFEDQYFNTNIPEVNVFTDVSVSKRQSNIFPTTWKETEGVKNSQSNVEFNVVSNDLTALKLCETEKSTKFHEPLEKLINLDNKVTVKVFDNSLCEEQYFNTNITQEKVLNLRISEAVLSKRQSNMSSMTRKESERPKIAQSSAQSNVLSNGPITFNLSQTEEETEFHEPLVAAWEKRRNVRPIANVENPTTAYDLAMKLRLERKANKTKSEENRVNNENISKRRNAQQDGGVDALSSHGSMPRESKWSGHVDSKGFRILSNQIIDVQSLTREDLVGYLKDSIIYEDENLLAIDKPYGLPSHGGPGVHHSVGKLLDPLAARLKRSGSAQTDLYLVHRLDKETTGVMVLAKSQQIYEFLLTMFKKRQVTKRYWLITKGIPDPVEGVVDIPMGEGTVGDRYRMELRPHYSSDARQVLKVVAAGHGPELEAVTNYRVLSSNNSSALVECTPETGVKHQIRCHMAFGLNTPILGDHKYSHYTKMVPQRLHPEMLRRLGIRQAKVRHVPMHLHAKALVLPEFKDGRNLFLSARLPKHFVQNMKWLQLTPPS